MTRRTERGFLIWASRRPKCQPRNVAGNDDGLIIPALVMVACAVVAWWLA